MSQQQQQQRYVFCDRVAKTALPIVLLPPLLLPPLLLSPLARLRQLFQSITCASELVSKASPTSSRSKIRFWPFRPLHPRILHPLPFPFRVPTTDSPTRRMNRFLVFATLMMTVVVAAVGALENATDAPAPAPIPFDPNVCFASSSSFVFPF